MASMRAISASAMLLWLGWGVVFPDVSPVTSTSKVYFADLNGDGLLDLAHGDNFIIRIYLNQGTAAAPLFTDYAYDFTNTLEYQRPCPAFCDIDLDGDMDFFFGISIGTIVYYRNDGSAGSPAWTLVNSGEPWDSFGGINDTDPMNSLNFVDFDGDGDQDITFNVVNGEMRYYSNRDLETDGYLDGQGVTWQRIPYLTPFYMAGGDGGKHNWVDEDGDGDFDCLIGYAEYGLSIRRNNGGPTFHQNYTWESVAYHDDVTGSFPSPFFDDFDGDGFLDIHYTSNLGYLRFLPGLTRAEPEDQDTLVPPLGADDLAVESCDPDGLTLSWPKIVDAPGGAYRSGVKFYELHRGSGGPGFPLTAGTLLWRHFMLPHYPDYLPEVANGDKLAADVGHFYYRDEAPPAGESPCYRLRVVDFAGNAATTAGIEAYLTGDLNLDRSLDGLDLSLLAGFLSGNPVAAFTAPAARADLDGDGQVSAADLAALLLELTL